MRHRVDRKHFSRTSSHRTAMRRNMVCSLIEHETISTTLQKAKDLRRFAERLVTISKKGDLAARRRAISLLGGNRAIYGEVDGEMSKTGTVVGKLFSDIGPRYLDRAGGYTRIIKLAKPRLGDNGKVVLIQFVGNETKPAEKKKTKKAKPKKAESQE